MRREPLVDQVQTAASRRSSGAAEDIRTCEQADDQIAVAGKVEEVAGVDEQVLLLEQPDHAFVLGHRVRDAQHRRPAAFRAQHLTDGCRATAVSKW